MFEKLFKYIGKSIKALIDRTDEPHCLRLHKNRVFYVRESLMRRATNVSCALLTRFCLLDLELGFRGCGSRLLEGLGTVRGSQRL